MIGRYIAGIGALIWNPLDETYLLLKRATTKDYGAEMWECVTGRLDQGESFEDALRREVREEIGIEVQPEFLLGTSHFYRGEAIPENELIGVFYCCSTNTPEAIQTSDEHSEYRWLKAEDALALIAATRRPDNQWLHNVIVRAEHMRRHIPDELRQIFLDEGFETE